ncbi:MAG: hypothetical protein Q8R45_10585 [Brevundimonas sp.]|nr:hypothetical protein [Brevundimonas sp.]MDO9587364.1 hypothetical protein [Brevundimonas sp.]MDP3369773.1 hypothetical protein [Brevundimonas sp.]MDP3657396.1 hypothetical protein [Brevundimonas sp.]MDZ4108086.1 hypothetical protein [Brevundimonas sp.]
MRGSTIAGVCLISTIVLAGCNTVRIPVNRTVDAHKVCGEMAARGCAPTIGAHFPFRRQYKTITVDDGGAPNLMSHLGRIVAVGNRTGDPGADCGLTNADRSPTPTQRNDVALSYTVAQKIGSSFEADLVQALEAARIPASIRDRFRADIRAVASSFDNQVINVTAEFSEHQLRPSTLDRLDSQIAGEPAAGSCAARIKSGQYRLVQAVSAIYVPGATASFAAGYDLVGGLGARLMAAGHLADEAAVAALTADVEERVKQKLNVSVQPYYAVIGVSYWTPPSL